MSSGLTRVATNIQAMQSLNYLNKTNAKIARNQLNLATGKKINTPGDDPAGYQLARGLEARRNGLEAALDNVNNANSILNIADGGYQNIMDILQTMKSKATQAADGSLGTTQRTAINDQFTALRSEIDQIVTETTFNDVALIDGTFSVTFQTGEGASETLSVALSSATSTGLGINAVSLTTQASASAAITTFDTAINTLSSRAQDVGEYKARLVAKENTLSTAITNTEAVRSTYEDADFAKEQMEVLKMQILQQTAVSSLSQANSAPQLVLSLF
jgi:flagellin